MYYVLHSTKFIYNFAANKNLISHFLLYRSLLNYRMTEDTNIKSQMRKGILEYCVLLLLSREKAYPSDIINRLSEASLIVVEGTLYTLLNRLRKEGKLNYEWQESTMGPPRKYYFITQAGKQSLIEMSKAWDEIVANVNHFRNISNSIEDEKDS